MIYTDFTVDCIVMEMEEMARREGLPKRCVKLLHEGADAVRQMKAERDKVRRYGPWIRPEDGMPEPLTSVLICRPARAKGDPLTVDMGYLRPDGTWRVHGTPLNRVLGWMPAPKGMEED